MKRHLIYFVVLTLIMSGCKENAPSFTTYTGVIVEKNSMNPIPGLAIKITDGHNVYSESVTDGMGQFSIDFAHNTSLGMLYIDINGGETYPSKRIDLIFTSESKYDYGMIYLYDQTDESLMPKIDHVTWDFPNDNKSMHFKNVSIVSSYTLEETYVEIAKSSNLSGSKKYPLEKQADGRYAGTVTGLDVGEKYYFQVVATNTIGTGKSELFNRTFGMAFPEIVELTSATVNSAVISIRILEEPLTTLSAGICWSTSGLPTVNDNSTPSSSMVASSVKMSGIDFSEHSYYVRAYAKNANGVSYSEVLELPVNNPYSLPTFKSGGKTYTYVYLGKGSWYTAYNACESFELVFNDWKLPNIGIMPDFFNTYYAENGETLLMPVWSMRNDEYWESGESETFMLTTNGEIIASKNTQGHYYAVRKF